jgi:hypothetical protein
MFDYEVFYSLILGILTALNYNYIIIKKKEEFKITLTIGSFCDFNMGYRISFIKNT